MKHLDIYGVQYAFKFFGYDRYNSYFSLVLSIITMISMLIMMLVFGTDMYATQHPRIVTQIAVPDPDVSWYNNSKNFTIAWNVADEKGIVTPLDNFLYPYFIYNIEGKEIKQAPVKCNSLNNLDPFFETVIKYKNEKLEDWYCLDLTSEQFNLIQLWRHQISFSFRLFYCTDGDVTSSSCTPYNKLYDELVIKSKMLNLIVPDYMFDSLDNFSPLRIGYTTFSKPIDLQLIKKMDIFFRRINIVVDSGWLWESLKSLTYITKTSYMMDIWKSFTKDQYLAEKSLYMVDFIFDRKFDSYAISYLKLMELAANVGGFLGIIMFFFQIFSNLYNGHYMKLTLYDKLFDFSGNSMVKNELNKIDKLDNIEMKETVKNNKKDKNDKHDNMSEYSKVNNTGTKTNNNTVININKNVMIYEEPNELHNDQQKDVPKEERDDINNGDHSNPITPETMTQFLVKKKENCNSLEELIKKNKTDEEKKQMLDKNLEIAGKFEDKLTDFGCYANLFMEFEYIKTLLLNPKQIRALKLVKLSINNTDRVFMENFLFNPVEDSLDEQTQIDVMNYFINKIDTNQWNNSDRLILKLLDIEYKNLIEAKIANKESFRNLMENPYENH